MTKLIPHNRDRLEDEATDWLVRLTSGEATPDEFAELAKWRQRSPAHQYAYQKIAGLWDQLDIPLLAWHEQHEQSGLEVINHENSEYLATELPSNTAKAGNARAKYVAIAATVLLILSFSLFPDYFRHPFADYRTYIGEQTAATLADGTVIHLNTNTAINLMYTSHIRHVELLQGEAEFAVAHDKDRPFVVTSGAVKTRAIGTKFVVRHENEQSKISLLEGRVRLAAKEESGHKQKEISLNPGQQVSYNNVRFSSLQPVDPTGATAWKAGRLLMNFVTLEQAVAEINRYRRGKVKVLSTHLAQTEINAVIDLHLIDAWLDALESSIPVKVHHLGPVILISAK
jgi:transmembrane sensor